MRMDDNSGKFRMKQMTEDFSPMEGVGNMADAMLVFACGLLLALIISWNVDVSETGEITKAPEVKYEVDNIGDSTEQDAEKTVKYLQNGHLYIKRGDRLYNAEGKHVNNVK